MLTLALAVFALASPHGTPDSWMPFSNQRIVAENGRDYVVAWWRKKSPTQTKDWPRTLRIEVARAADGSPAVSGAISGFKTGTQAPDAIGVRKGDTRLASFDLDRAPIRTFFDADGVTFFECHGSVGLGPWSIQSFRWNGTRRYQHAFADLKFTAAESAHFTPTVSSLWYYDKAWIDRKNNELIIAGKKGAMRGVDLRSGAVRSVGPDAFGRFLASYQDFKGYEWMKTLERYADDMIDDPARTVGDTTAHALTRVLAAAKSGRLGQFAGAAWIETMCKATDPTVRALAIRSLPYATKQATAVDALREVFARRESIDPVSRHALARALFLLNHGLDDEVATLAREGERFALPALFARAKDDPEGPAARGIVSILESVPATSFADVAHIVVFLTHHAVPGVTQHLERLAKELRGLPKDFAGSEALGFGMGENLVSKRFIESTEAAIARQGQ